jgi:hypothetical protein
MIITNEHSSIFLHTISGFAPAVVLVDHILGTFGSRHDVEVHFTRTDGSDLRVRAHREGQGRRSGQNIFTMAWRPAMRVFSCKILASAVNGGPVSNLRLVNDPLPHAFHLDPVIPGSQGTAGQTVVSFIDAAIAGWR